MVRVPPDLEALAGTVEGREEARAIERGEPEALRLYGERAGRILDRGGPGFDELRGTLLSRYSGRPGRSRAPSWCARARPSSSPTSRRRRTRSSTGLIAGLSGAATTVGAEASGADPSSIGFFDAEGLPTVDSIDLVSGRVALVFALTGSADGNFGIKETADSLLPDLLAPDGGEGGTGGDPEAQGG